MILGRTLQQIPATEITKAPLRPVSILVDTQSSELRWRIAIDGARRLQMFYERLIEQTEEI
jgi:hypothetical protein